MIEEIWKPIPNYEGLYEASNLGNIRNFYTKRILKGEIVQGYHKVLIKNIFGKLKSENVHRLVAKSFIPNPDNYPIINHKDGNKINNCVDNLEWCTYSYNTKHAIENNLFFQCKNHDEMMKMVKLSIAKTSHKVKQYDLDGNLIKVWDSVNQARKYNHISDKSIKKCCKGIKKSAGGYIWEYVK